MTRSQLMAVINAHNAKMEYVFRKLASGVTANSQKEKLNNDAQVKATLDKYKITL